MSAIDRSYDEKRNFIRMQVNSSISITYAGKNYTAFCKDLSATGMMIVSKEHFEMNAELEVTINQPDPNRKPFNAMVTVVRIKPLVDEDQEIGLMIKEILP